MKSSRAISYFLTVSAVIFSFKTHADNTLENILDHAQTAIQKIEGDKIFIKPEKVCLHEGLIVLENDQGETVALPHLYSIPNVVQKLGFRLRQSLEIR